MRWLVKSRAGSAVLQALRRRKYASLPEGSAQPLASQSGGSSAAAGNDELSSFVPALQPMPERRQWGYLAARAQAEWEAAQREKLEINLADRAVMYVLHRVHPKMIAHETLISTLVKNTVLFVSKTDVKTTIKQLKRSEMCRVGLVAETEWLRKYATPTSRRRRIQEFGVWLREKGLNEYKFVAEEGTLVEKSLRDAVSVLVEDTPEVLPEGRYEKEWVRPELTEEEKRLKDLRWKLIKSRKARFSRMKQKKYRHPKPPPKSKKQLKAEADAAAAAAAAAGDGGGAQGVERAGGGEQLVAVVHEGMGANTEGKSA
mmetsp:Transcript_3469/g.7511  ORF Transcript_3469/g.7511 Transcript_3469/m.7511 type:complete len:315 (-) Transcript_3469:1150-2094(-)